MIGYNSDDECDIPALESLKDLIDEFKEYEEEEFADERSRRFVALVKGYGIAADVAASAVAKKQGKAISFILFQILSLQTYLLN